ncbi:bicyclomycin resistance protein [Aspergillus nomiae NRRL 13137]|uniref:Bicyclomycin resistance protein n=1 Tax=Aspergillus nomiae NRRL (strain ATCC 15546 / NRRL 13137 / CBS 260.88 / M93) TaxID=1509407 RepID=A0A0L1INC4_ASPN3|nr:bicyclomycin resistance protein [Aspergillus nomiae NRRL 13137]KNG80718.1 bicyclomycin resistance protein [Aspergillus nomiae NRRL 13137]
MHSGLSNGVPGASQRTYPRKMSFWRLMTDHQVLTKEIVEYDYPGSGTKDDPFVVSWLNEDPRNPLQFSMAKKVAITLVTAFATLIVSLTSSAYSGSISDIVRRFEVSTEVATLGLSLFIFGFSVGPLVWAPLSESIGRQIPFFISFLSMAAFLAGCAGARNIQTLLILRFFAGTFGSSPLTNAGGVVSDMFPARQRGLALCLFASTPYMGPALGPMIGGFLSMNAGWRWVEGLLAACAGLVWIVVTISVPETYAPVLLRKRAAKLSRETGKCYLSKLDVGKSPVAWTSRLKTVFSRPWVLLCREPIVLLFTFYASVIYGTLYMLFAAFPIVYEQGRGWNPGVGGLPFLGVMVGMFAGVGYAILDNGRYVRTQEKFNGFAPPEARLVPCMVSAVTIPIGFFWFAWTNSPSIHWMASVAAMVPFGSGLVLIYLGIVNYLIDSYTIYAASVIAAMSILRYSFGGIFPLFTTYMYEGLGIHWASSIPAFVSVACMPLPFIFYKYGADIRKRCKYAAISAKHLQTIQETAEEEIRRNAVATQPNAAV